MSPKKPDKIFNERAQHLLKVLVQRYIEEGQPVGSKTLVSAANMELSPATIRNIMSELEDLGFVESPHTSAGRVPTIQGYRFFVDSLINMQSTGRNKLAEELQEHLKRKENTQQLVAGVSEFLSGITKLAGIVTLPRIQRIILRQLEFIPLSNKRVLAILVTGDQEVQNRILHLHREFDADELRQISNFFNSNFSGQDIPRVRDTLTQQMHRDHEHLNQLMQAAVEMAENLFADDSREDYVLAGQVNLMGFDELSNVEKLRQLFEAFNQKRDILHLLDQCVSSEGVQIFIGQESGYKIFNDCSVVTAPYSLDGKVIGVLGVIGPTRMPYDRVIPIVDITAKVLGAALNSKF